MKKPHKYFSDQVEGEWVSRPIKHIEMLVKETKQKIELSKSEFSDNWIGNVNTSKKSIKVRFKLIANNKMSTWLPSNPEAWAKVIVY